MTLVAAGRSEKDDRDSWHVRLDRMEFVLSLRIMLSRPRCYYNQATRSFYGSISPAVKARQDRIMRIGRSVGPCRRAIITQRCCVESLALCDSRGSVGPRQYCTVSERSLCRILCTAQDDVLTVPKRSIALLRLPPRTGPRVRNWPVHTMSSAHGTVEPLHIF